MPLNKVIKSLILKNHTKFSQKKKKRKKKKKKRSCHLVDFVVLADSRIKIKKNSLRIEETMERKGNGNTNCHWNPWNGSQVPGKKTRGT